MAEDLLRILGTKDDVYKGLFPQIVALIGNEKNVIANLGNICAALKEAFGFFWIGFYIVNDGELVLGPFQGPVACTRIQKGKGVCGAAWAEEQTVLVPNVDLFAGHIACSSLSKSEIVVPLFKNGEVVGVLDVDSDKLEAFDQTDKQHLEKLCQWVSGLL
jgi:L-methionine (R)-S-oxide reductase